jgi:MerR family transcriptional regulator, mercuric resistance operon regulatory protein
MPEHLSIGQLAKRTGCQDVTIRYYERIGMLPAPVRSAGGHRVYGPEHQRRLAFIRRGRDLGFSLDAIRSLLGLAERRDASCAEVDAIARAHLAEVRQKAAALKRLETALEDLVHQCKHTTVCECRVVGALLPEEPAPDAQIRGSCANTSVDPFLCPKSKS